MTTNHRIFGLLAHGFAAADRWWRADAPATRLAAVRLLVGGFAVVYLAARLVHLFSFVEFPAEQFAPVGVINILAAPLPPWLVVALASACLPLAVAFTLGWRYAITGPAFAAVLLWVLSYRNSWGMIFHTENLLVLHVMVLGLVPAADAWSLDARRQPKHRPLHNYGWPLRLMVVITVATYVIAGVAKLRLSGLEWVHSDLLRNYIAYDNLRKLQLGDAYSPIGAALVRQGWLFPPLAAVSLIMELAAPLALLGPRIGKIWALGAWAFHVGVLAVMAIFFPYPLFGFAFAPLFACERLRLWRWLGLSLAPPTQSC